MYKLDNYEEALELFKKARTENPQSAEAAFFLGLTYKQMGDFQSALPSFQDAVNLKPQINEAVIELIDVSMRLEKNEEARQSIAFAEKNHIYPAKTAFLKGLLFMKEAKYNLAIEAFEVSKNLDKSYTQAADLQIGIAYMAESKYDKAKARFQSAVTMDPASDFATFARRYQEIAEERRFTERPLRLSLTMLGQYDTNMLSEPHPYNNLPLDAGEEKSFGLLTTARLDFIPKMPGNWLFNASYAASSNLHEKNSTTYDTITNTLTLSPGYNFGRFGVSLLSNYTNALKRGSGTIPQEGGGYRQYSDYFSVGPLVRVVLGKEQNYMFEFYSGYLSKNYSDRPIVPDEDQNSWGIDSYISWMMLFKNGGMLLLKYGYTTEDAIGQNNDYDGHKITASAIVPVWKAIKLQLTGEAYFQGYRNANSISAFNGAKRSDKTYTGNAGLIWDLHRSVSLMAMYTITRGESNIFAYDYDKSIYSLGVEIKF